MGAFYASVEAARRSATAWKARDRCLAGPPLRRLRGFARRPEVSACARPCLQYVGNACVLEAPLLGLRRRSLRPDFKTDQDDANPDQVQQIIERATGQHCGGILMRDTDEGLIVGPNEVNQFAQVAHCSWV
jgi:hypothetical protein